MYIAGSRVVREKRSRIVKYFETADKGCSAVVYPEAVHFKENGEWKEIDHILVEDEKDDIRAFQLEEDGSPRTLHRRYTYNAQNDQITGVSAGGSQTRSVSYTYDAGSRLKSISHNGTVYAYTYDGFGNQTAVSAGGSTLEQYTYLPGNGPLSEVRYGNGSVMKNIYDKQERITAQQWDGVAAYEYEYDDFGALQKHRDLAENVEYEYRYDMTGRMVNQWTSHGQALDIGYDEKGRVDSIVQGLDDAKVKTKYLYGDVSKQQRPGLLYGMEIDGTERLSVQYDDLGRKKFVNVKLDDGLIIPAAYTYHQSTPDGKTNLLPRYYFGPHDTYYHEYDEVGNISLIAKVSGGKVIYAYDSLNQLIREDNEFLGKTICYTYDLGGNMISRKEYTLTSGSVAALTPAKTDTFTYRSSGWKDQLTAYNGQNITYDGMGNPTSYRGMAMEWKKGRQLSKITKADGTVLNFAYDSEGNRVRKTAGGVTTQYYLSGGQIVGMKQGTDVMQFVYDPDGQPFMMRLNGTDYYYTYNVQGDVVSLIDRSNTKVVEYQYDSWGKPTLISDTSADFVMISQKSLPVWE